MKKIRRLVKKYERWFMIALVVLLLVIFTVVGSITGSASDRDGPAGAEVAGSFALLAADRTSITNGEFARARTRYELSRRARRGGVYEAPDELEVWTFLLLLEAAKREGITVSDAEVRDEIGRSWGPRFLSDPATYKAVLTSWRVTPRQYESAVKAWLTTERVRDIYRETFEAAPPASRMDLVKSYESKGTEYAEVSWIALDADGFLVHATAELQADKDPDKTLRSYFESEPDVQQDEFINRPRYSFEMLYTMHERVKTEEDYERVKRVFLEAFPEVTERDLQSPASDYDVYIDVRRDRLLKMSGYNSLTDVKIEDGEDGCGEGEGEEPGEEKAGGEDGQQPEGCGGEEGDPKPPEDPLKPGDEDEAGGEAKTGEDLAEEFKKAQEEWERELEMEARKIEAAHVIVFPQARREVDIRTMYIHMNAVALQDESKSLEVIFKKLQEHDDPENPITSTERGKGIFVYRALLKPLTSTKIADLEDAEQKFTFNFSARVTKEVYRGGDKVSLQPVSLGVGEGRAVFRVLSYQPEKPKTFDELTEGEKTALRDEFYIPHNARLRAKEKLQKLHKLLTEGKVKAEDFAAEGRRYGGRVYSDEGIEASGRYVMEPDPKMFWHEDYLHMRDRHFLRKHVTNRLRADQGDQKLGPGSLLDVVMDERDDADVPGAAYLVRLEKRQPASAETMSTEELNNSIRIAKLTRRNSENRWWTIQFQRLMGNYDFRFSPDMQRRVDEEIAKRNNVSARRGLR
ncbi:MAG: SurA N-terminal domain-containing protein [Planctomycetota bacterium]|nr:SurA N-terminal domain-containing protein [Planctomycetota bacterium]